MLSFIACCTHIYEWFQVTLSLEVSCSTNNFYVSNVLVSGPSVQSCFYISVDWTLPYLNQIVVARLKSDLIYNSAIQLACALSFLCCARGNARGPC